MGSEGSKPVQKFHTDQEPGSLKRSTANENGADENSPREEIEVFEPDVQIAWIIDCAKPMQGENPKKPAWVSDAKDLCETKLGFHRVFESVNCTNNSLFHDFKKMEARLTISKEYQENTFLMVYYRGEGGLDRRTLDTYAITQDGGFAPVEHYIRELAAIFGSYVFGVFDCGRQMLGEEIGDGTGWTADG
jgi:hypothetical protein